MDTAIDLHGHLLPTAWLDEVARHPDTFGLSVKNRDGTYQLAALDGNGGFAVPPGLHDVDRRLAAMAEMGVTAQLAAPPTPALGYELPVPQARAVARLFNETVADLAKGSDGRLIPAATVPMSSSADAVRELDHAVDVLGLRLVFISTSVAGRDLHEDDFRPFFRRAAELGVPVQLHPAQHEVHDRLQHHFLENLLGNPMDTAIAVGCLISGGVLDELPDLRLVLVHGGGVFPYLLGRMRHGYAEVPAARGSRRAPPEYVERCWFDTLVHDQGALDFLVRSVGSDRLVIGTDSPYPMGDAAPLETLAGVGLDADEAVLHGTASALLDGTVGRPTAGG